jgi:hypothetical protein
VEVFSQPYLQPPQRQLGIGDRRRCAPHRLCRVATILASAGELQRGGGGLGGAQRAGQQQDLRCLGELQGVATWGVGVHIDR